MSRNKQAATISTSLTSDQPVVDEVKSSNEDRPLVIISILVGATVLVLWYACGAILYYDDQRGTFGDMFGAVNALFSGLAFAGVVVAILLQKQEMQESRREFIKSAEEQRRFYTEERNTNVKESTDTIFREWWSDDMNQLRLFFFRDFLPTHWGKLANCSLKEIEHKISDDGKIRRLTGFFDRVGWLGAAGLIDVDFVLGPMQHVVRRVWFVTEPLIVKEREAGKIERLDPVYRLGFEWLFKRTEIKGKQQAELLARRFQEPALISEQLMQTLQQNIYADEERFKRHLDGLRRQHEDTVNHQDYLETYY